MYDGLILPPTAQAFAGTRSGRPSYNSQAGRWLVGWLLLALALLGCDDFARRPRRFGASCGVAAECESGICHNGQCTKACQSAGDCGALGVCIENFCQGPDLDYDADTLTNGYEAKWGLAADNPDTDGDGILDADEIGFNPDNPADQNGDGIIDAAQSNILDADQDCIVDAFDVVKGGADPLPDPAVLCNRGACAGLPPEQLKTTCTPPATPPDVFSVAEGCAGCICEAPGAPNWQATESWCDSLDNDCDGKTDEELAYDGVPLGLGCIATQGICQFAPPGVVECGSDKQVTCSTAANGSASAAAAESCNGLDDDCDGATDEDFLWNGIGVGQSCSSCGGETKLCPNNVPANTPVVTCGLDGQSAVCSGVPFEDGFVRVADGAPLPHRRWSAAYAPAWNQLLVYGGRVPTDSVRTVSHQFLAFDLNGATPHSWQRLETAAGPGPRSGAALVWDAVGERMLLLGGRNASSLDTSVWAWDGSAWAELTDDASDAGFAWLPAGAQVPGNESLRQSALAAVLSDGNERAVVLLDPRYLRAKVHPLGDGAETWEEPEGDVSASSGPSVCLVAKPDGSEAYALRTDGNLTRFGWLAGDVVSSLYEPATPTSLPVEGAQCFWAGDASLHVVGGLRLDGTKFGHVRIDLGDPQWSWEALSLTSAVEQAVARSGGFALPTDVSAVVIGGGIAEADGGPVPADSVWQWDFGTQTAARIDAPAPRGRIGHASGFRTKTNEVCIAGGLLFELPKLASNSGTLVDPPAQTGRVVPATDAWCATLDGKWRLLADNLAPHAFGMAAVDGPGDKLVLAGGLQLTAGTPLAEVSRIWTGEVISNGALLAQFLPTQQTILLDLETGSASSVAIAGMPALAAPGQAWDPLRQRIVLFGGWGESGETQTFAALDVAKRTWTDLYSKMTNPQGQRPQPRYGSLVFYHPVLDVFGLVAGAAREYSNGLPGPKVQDLVTPDVPVAPVGCYVNAHTALWLASVDKSFADFSPQPLRKFGSVTASGPADPLLVPWAGGPAFLPILFDVVGNRAWLAVPTGPLQSTIAADGSQCPTDVLQPGVTPEKVDRSISLVAGVCSGQQVIDLEKKQLTKLPDAMLMAAGLYITSSRTSVVYGGLSPQRTLLPGLWRLQQTCTTP